MTKNFTVLATGKIDGTAYRLIELATVPQGSKTGAPKAGRSAGPPFPRSSTPRRSPPSLPPSLVSPSRISAQVEIGADRFRGRYVPHLIVNNATPEVGSMSPIRKSENFTVLETGHIDGGAYRVVKFGDGSARVENWGPKGWTPGGATFGEISNAPPVGAAFAAKLGIPISDLGSPKIDEAALAMIARAKAEARSRT